MQYKVHPSFYLYLSACSRGTCLRIHLKTYAWGSSEPTKQPTQEENNIKIEEMTVAQMGDFASHSLVSTCLYYLLYKLAPSAPLKLHPEEQQKAAR